MKKIVYIALIISVLLSSCDLFSPTDVLQKLADTIGNSIVPADIVSPNIGILKGVPPGVFQYDGTVGNTNAVSAAFHMSQYDITRTQYVAVTGLADPVISGGQTAYSSGTNDPVMYVSWYRAIYFCNKLSMKEGLTPVYTVNGSTDPVNWPGGTNIPIPANPTYDAATANWSANGYRLPTEMEWMWAAMGGDKNKPGRINLTGQNKSFAGSTGVNNISNYIWYVDNSGGKTHPVGTKLPNELGLYDMSGNVFQWCWDLYNVYPGGALTDYRGVASAPTGTGRIVRGGCWSSPAPHAAVGYRTWISPDSLYGSFGFRVVRP